ncbi:MgtC/SapB family protein [Dactylosporangium sp. CA-139114]|uniref:MgtC/SapB family protein n=1 Tax=Dactylosporangium sp. CA-139114 TaxID=3239931 RepID=UPI003D99E18A
MVDYGWVVVGQVLLAAGLGAVIGLEREFGAQPAGLRTHILVSLGAALFTLAGVGLQRSDPTRVAAQVVTGIGFLGGGAIFKEGVTVRGLTTAASLWVTAAVGLAVGLRAWPAALVTTVLTVTVLWLLKVAERHYLALRRHLLMCVTLKDGVSLDEVERELLKVVPRATMLRVTYAEHEHVIEMTARPPATASLPQLAESLRRLPGIVGVNVSG